MDCTLLTLPDDLLTMASNVDWYSLMVLEDGTAEAAVSRGIQPDSLRCAALCVEQARGGRCLLLEREPDAVTEE